MDRPMTVFRGDRHSLDLYQLKTTKKNGRVTIFLALTSVRIDSGDKASISYFLGTHFEYPASHRLCRLRIL
jgi:hypothetical protein